MPRLPPPARPTSPAAFRPPPRPPVPVHPSRLQAIGVAAALKTSVPGGGAGVPPAARPKGVAHPIADAARVELAPEGPLGRLRPIASSPSVGLGEDPVQKLELLVEAPAPAPKEAVEPPIGAHHGPRAALSAVAGLILVGRPRGAQEAETAPARAPLRGGAARLIRVQATARRVGPVRRAAHAPPRHLVGLPADEVEGAAAAAVAVGADPRARATAVGRVGPA